MEMTKDTKPTGLALLREPFPANAISKLPKPTKKQTDDLSEGMRNGDFSLGIRCEECGGWHHKDAIHLDYVGHAALTDRLLDCDPHWNWEPLSFNEQGNPQFDSIGGMWIKLTVCDTTRLGYGNPDGKTGGNAIKEVIGDALRNAAMRFGAALDLWHKGDLHVDDAGLVDDTPKPADKPQEAKAPTKDEIDGAIKWLNESPDTKVLGERKASLKQNRPHVWDKSPAVREAATAREATLADIEADTEFLEGKK